VILIESGRKNHRLKSVPLTQKRPLEGYIPAACRCSSLTVFSGYSTKQVMAQSFQKFFEQRRTPSFESLTDLHHSD
jgi:hypothetical protein